MPSERDLKFGILGFLKERGRRNKWNTLGNPGQRGDLELWLDTSFDAATRARAERAWNLLHANDLIRPDYGSLSGPQDWVEITESGQHALERHALDALDEALIAGGERFVEMRDASWSQLDGHGTDSGRQAAGSMCELIDQLLHHLAPTDAIIAARWYTAVEDSKTKVSRFQRARLLMERQHGHHDESRCKALVAAHDGVQKLKHSRRFHDRETVESAIRFAENALREVLLWPTRDDGPEVNAAGEDSSWP